MEHVVQPGDCMASIAVTHGFFWQTLWNLPQNSGLKDKRKNPYVLHPGDVVYIPDSKHKEEVCVTGKQHRFRVKGVPERLHIVFTDELDQPIPNQPYVLTIDGKLKFQGQTDGAGAINQPIPPDARTGRLVLGKNRDQRVFELKLGGVDPVDELTGVQGRLYNLGYYDGAIDGIPSAQLTTALLLFQDKYDLPPSGLIDQDTKEKLKKLFGC